MSQAEDFRAAIEREWQRALAHAKFDSSEARLWICHGWGSGSGAERPDACYWPPWLDIDDDRGFFTTAQRAEVESDEARPLHRIAVFDDPHPETELGDTLLPIIGATLRHELEHARQQQRCPEVLALDHFLDHVVRVKIAGLPGDTELFNLKPIEQDANAAAAEYLRVTHPEHLDAIRTGPSNHLARSHTPAESIDTLLARTVACLFLFRDVCEREWNTQIPFWQHLDVYDPARRAGRLWRELDTGEDHQKI